MYGQPTTNGNCGAKLASSSRAADQCNRPAIGPRSTTAATSFRLGALLSIHPPIAAVAELPEEDDSEQRQRYRV